MSACLKALSLFAVFLLAKVLVLFDRDVPLSMWSPLAYLWQDALVALILGLIEFLTQRRPWIAGSTYTVAVLYVAINVPLTRVLSSPLTWKMSRAASGALADSIKHYLTWENLIFMALILIAGALLPRILRRLPPWSHQAAMACGAALAVAGPFASARIECAGLHRNALLAWVSSVIPRVGLTHEELDWRATSGEAPSTPDFSEFHGAAAGRNIVMIALESTGAKYLRPYGATNDPMPHLTKLAATSLLFESAYAVYPESIKGLFSVLCSRYPAFDISPKAFEQVTTPSIARVLGDAGYRTGLFHSGRFMYLGMDSVIRDRGFDIMEDAGSIGGHINSSFGVDEPSTVKRMLQWIDGSPRGQPFLLTYLPIAGHHPYETPEPGPFTGSDDGVQYRNALHYADAALGELLQGLQARHLASNTVFVIFGDHGEAFGQHQGNYGHTLFLYEENVRVPCLIVAPGLFQTTIRVSRLASLIDVAPTVLDLVGCSIPSDYQGASLLRPQVGMALFYTDYSLPLVGLRDGPWKFIHELGSSRSKLFNLDQDPSERISLAAGFPERVQDYRHRLERWSKAQRGRMLAPATLTSCAPPGGSDAKP
jgi:glucan phosphoethanolaminetransferase (alkaline phosphatase superfamily)